MNPREKNSELLYLVLESMLIFYFISASVMSH